MEIDRKPDARGVFEDVVVVRDRRLRIAREEIHLHAGDAEILDLLRTPRAASRASSMRSRGVSGVVFHSPAELYQTRIFTFFGRAVFDQLLQSVVADLPVPGRIHQRVLPAHLGGVVDEPLLHLDDGVVVA